MDLIERLAKGIFIVVLLALAVANVYRGYIDGRILLYGLAACFAALAAMFYRQWRTGLWTRK